MNIISKEEWNNFCDTELSEYDKAIINGKGPTFKPITSPIQNTLCVCVNDCLHASSHTDLFVCSDIEFFERVDHSKLKDLKYIAVANKIHRRARPRAGLSYLNVIELIKDSFSGDVIVYNLAVNPGDHERYKVANPNFITLRTRLSTGNSAADVVSLIPKIKKVTTYGIATGVGYSDEIEAPSIKTVWNPEFRRAARGRGNLEKIMKELEESLKDKNFTAL